MKQTLIFLLIVLLYPQAGISQVSDDFSDGNFTSDPEWSGNTADFEVNSGGQLHLKANGADTSLLITQSAMIREAEWNFWVKLSFNTSANNFARFYLSGDQPDLNGNVNGYYLQIGGGSDSVHLFRQENQVHTPLLTLKSLYTGNSVNVIRFRVVHDKEGLWTVFADPAGNNSYVEEGRCTDNLISASVCLGVWCRFTSSNATKFYFDDIYAGAVKIDSVPPILQSVGLESDSVLKVTFSEPVDKGEGETRTNYLATGHGIPGTVKADSLDGRIIRLAFTDSFGPGTCDTLIIKKAKDLNGNTSENLEGSFCLYSAGTYDIVIDEIMADPTPQTGLPDTEYAELFNRSSYPVSLKGWTFTSGTTVKTFPDISMDPGEFLILSKGNLLSFYGRNLDLFTSSSTLPNDGAILTLRNAEGRVIHSVSYSSGWYRNAQKEDGGWSLEMADPGNPCGGESNWFVSEHLLGGTPGTANSVNHPVTDTLKPLVFRVSAENDSMIRVIFSETIDTLSFPPPGQWMMTGEDLYFTRSTAVNPLYRELLLQLSEPLVPGKIHYLSIPPGLRDCSGNQLETEGEIRFALPDTVSESDLVINEVLPDPYPDGERFVELYNRSEKPLDLRQLVLLDHPAAPGGKSDPVNITEAGFLVFPEEYVVLSKSPADIATRYEVPGMDRFVTMTSMPGMTKNDSGRVILARKNDLVIIDEMRYSTAMQYPLLSSPEGVSLERIDPGSSSAERSNWHSASGSSGYATPGYRNSQSMVEGEGSSPAMVEPELFSPDNDGRDDIAFIMIRPEKPGFLVNISVYSSSGEMTRQLVRSAMAEAEGVFPWDGMTETGRKAQAGIYIILVEMIHPGGETRKYKLPVVLGSAF